MPLRRRVLIGVVLVALAAVPAAGSTLRPIKREFGEATFPRLRVGKLTVPKAHDSGRLRVIVTLRLPPLARAYGHGLFGATAGRKLNVHTASSHAYLARIDNTQAKAIAQLRRAIPSARVSRRFRIVLDGITVSVPVRALPALARQSFAQHVWPSLTYHQFTNHSPAVIGADVFHQRTGDNGEGVKIGVVDDGVDNTNPFLSGDGFTAPAGFPLGDAQFTSGKVIVARAFPGPGSGDAGKQPLDRRASFHGTHVAGIAAGDAGTCSPGGADHPPTCGLSGIAPRAFIGNYRVFNVPTSLGNIAESPEIAAAFEQAVADGMDVINFSGGGPESEPANDVLIAAVNNVAAAGVVPVIAAGNDRDQFGMGTVGSPGTASGAISVAAVSNAQVFAPALTALDSAGRELLRAPIVTGASATPAGWATNAQVLTDVGTIVGRSGGPVNRYICGTAADPNGTGTELPANSLSGQVALVSRGVCTFASKAARVAQAGGVGMILVDNRPGTANPLPLDLPIPAGMIADLDGAQLRAAMQPTGHVLVRVGTAAEDIVNGRSGVVTSFSSGGPSALNHRLKPDVAAPGAQILSSTLREFSGGSPFAVFDGTSMATPHVTGAAALLVQHHPTWTPQEIKSALVTTAGPAWADTARTKEAAVTLEGGGLINVANADDPGVFTNPVSLSFGYLNVNHGAQVESLLVRVTDAGAGAGDWAVTLAPQTQTRGVTVSLPSLLSIAPGGDAALPVVARAAADAEAGEEMGFIVLTRGEVSRRIPYYFLVERPALESMPATELKVLQQGDTVRGTSKVSQYRFPAAPFGPAPSYTGPAVNEPGSETLYTTRLSVPVVNFGVSVVDQSADSIIDPWVLGSPDENDVQGYAGTPVNVNALMFDYGADIETAGTVFPLTKRYYVAVDSGSDVFTGKSLPGQYVLRSWVNDLSPPRVQLLTSRLASGRPTMVARVRDGQSGVDPLSLVIAYNNVLLGASAFDPTSGLAIFAVPPAAPQLTRAQTKATISASDFQEAKNVNTIGANVLPNTAFKDVKIKIVKGPAVTWLQPRPGTCVRATVPLLVVASSTRKVNSVAFFDGKKRIGQDRNGLLDLFLANWKATKAKKGKHILKATAHDASGRTYTATRSVRVCK